MIQEQEDYQTCQHPFYIELESTRRSFFGFLLDPRKTHAKFHVGSIKSTIHITICLANSHRLKTVILHVRKEIYYDISLNVSVYIIMKIFIIINSYESILSWFNYLKLSNTVA